MNLKYEGREYFAEIHDDYLSIGTGGEEFFRLSPVSAVDADGKKDTDMRLGAPEIIKSENELTVIFKADSSLWKKKEYIFHLTPDNAAYTVKVYGSGAVDTADFFTGDRSSRWFGSGYEAADYYAPLGLANSASPNRVFTMAQDTHLGFSGGFSPTPLSFSFRVSGIDERLLFGIAALPGNISFDGLTYHSLRFHPDISRFCLRVNFGGYQSVSDCWESPAIIIIPAPDDSEALRRYARWHYSRGLPRANTENSPPWWKGPFFCGWKEQAVIPGFDSSYDAAAQSCYETMSETLDKRGLRPSAIIIDDKWQEKYGCALPDAAKWPDFRRFVEEQHSRDRRVLLWFKSWDPEGLEEEECILDENGKRLGADPTSPVYRARIHALMHTLLSGDEGCFNADGFKVDFADCIPCEKNMRLHEKGVFGLSLMYKFMELLYTEAKLAKPDALLNTSCCHPLFAAFTDQARLHDTYFAQRDSAKVMMERADLFDAVIPGILIDTDAGACGSRRDFMRYARASAEFGIPDIYILNPVGDCALTESDWEEIRLIWEKYRSKIYN